MSGQVRQAMEAIAEVRGTFRDTREGRHCSVPVGFTAKHVRCLGGISRLHAPEVHSRSNSCSGLGDIEVDTNETFEEGLVCVVDSQNQVLRRKTVRLVRVLLRHRGVEESTWEREDTMRVTYPFLFRDEGTWFSRLILK